MIAAGRKFRKFAQPPANRSFAVSGAWHPPIRAEIAGRWPRRRRRMEPPMRLLKPQVGVAQDVPDDHQGREIPQREEPQLRILVRIEKDGGVERGSFHRAVSPFVQRPLAWRRVCPAAPCASRVRVSTSYAGPAPWMSRQSSWTASCVLPAAAGPGRDEFPGCDCWRGRSRRQPGPPACGRPAEPGAPARRWPGDRADRRPG